jgi:hypothetical protein
MVRHTIDVGHCFSMAKHATVARRLSLLASVTTEIATNTLKRMGRAMGHWQVAGKASNLKLEVKT